MGHWATMLPPSLTTAMAGRVSRVSDWNSPFSNLLLGDRPATSGPALPSSRISWKLSEGCATLVMRKVRTESSGTRISGSAFSRSTMAALVSRIGGLAV